MIAFEEILAKANQDAQQGKWEDALASLEIAVQTEPTHTGALSGLATCLITLNRAGEALPYLERVASLLPESADAYNNLGLGYTLDGQVDKAEQAYLSATQLDGEHIQAWKNLAVLYLQQERYVEGIQILAAVVQAHPEEVEATELLAQCYAAGEDYASARVLYEQIQRIEPDHPGARQALQSLPRPAFDPTRIARPEHARKLAALKGLTNLQPDAANKPAGNGANIQVSGIIQPIVFYGTGEVSDGVRLGVPAQGLLQEGFRVKVSRIPQTEDFDLFHVFIFSRPHLSPILMKFMHLCKQAGKRVVMDLDDDFHHVPQDHPGYSSVGPGNPASLRLLEEAISAADILTVATPVLADRYGALAKRVVVIPNGWNRKNPLWEKPAPTRSTVNIGWAGTITHRQDVALIKREVVHLMRDMPNTLLAIGGDYAVFEAFRAIPESRRLFLPMSPFEDYPYMLAHFDILLAPLRLNTFNESKSDIKLLEAGIRRIPWIASSTPAYQEWEIGGILAKKEGDWYAALKKLVTHADLRQELGQAGWEKAQTRTEAQIATKWREALFN